MQRLHDSDFDHRTLASEISMRFGFRGLSHIISTGCTSSTDAIGYAYRNIQWGVLHTMMLRRRRGCAHRAADSARLSGDADHDARAGINEPERASRPFSRDRDGFVLAEGAWFFVLEEMEQRGPAAPTSTARSRATLPPARRIHRVRLEECGEEPARAMRMAMEEAGIAPAAVRYINYHGTSTELNDRIETRAVKLAFNGHAYKLAGSSLKSLIGHPQGACGAAGVAATLLAHARRRRSPDHQCGRCRIPNAISTTFRARRARWNRVRGGQLHRVRQQEFGACAQAASIAAVLRQHLLHDFAFHIRQPEIAAHVVVRQARVIQAEAIEQRGLQIVHVDLVFVDVQAEIVGLADDLPRLDAAARQPHAVRQGMMIAAGVVGLGRIADLAHRRAAEFAAPDHQRLIQQPALLQILDQRRGRLVGDVAVLLQLLVEIGVIVPAGVHQHDEAHAALHHAARQQAIGGERLGRLLVHAVHLERGSGDSFEKSSSSGAAICMRNASS